MLGLKLTQVSEGVPWVIYDNLNLTLDFELQDETFDGTRNE